MASTTFSGHSGYRLVGVAGRSNRDIYVDVWVERTGTFTAWSTAQQGWFVDIDGVRTNATWTYDFRNATSVYLGRVWKYGVAIGDRYWGISVNMASGIGSASLTGYINIPPGGPAAPTLGTITRVSDTSQTINWTRNATVDAPYDEQGIQRRHYANGAWSAWTTVSTFKRTETTSGAEWFTDTSTVANRLYHYRIAAYNSAGGSASAESGHIYTTPGTPSAVEAEAVSLTEVKATVIQTVATDQFKTEMQYSSGGGAWQALVTLPNNGVHEHTFTPPAAADVKVRARVIIDNVGDVGHGLASGWRESNVVPLQQPPLAPTNLKPTGTTLDAALATTFTWTYTSGDTSGQKAYEIETKAGASAPWVSTGKVTSTSKSRVYAAGAFSTGVAHQWRVRTWGVHPDPSPWSNPASVTYANAPVAVIQSPSATVATSRVTLSWTPVSGQTSWTAELLRNGDVLETRSGATASSVIFSTQLDNDSAYSVRVRVRASSGLWSAWASRNFTTNFPEPTPPYMSLSWDAARGATLVDITNPAGGPAAASFNTVQRRYEGSDEWELVATNVPLNGIISDPEVRLNQTVHYRAMVTSTLDTSSFSGLYSIFSSSRVGFWSVGPGFSMSQTLRMDLGQPPGIDLETGLATRQRHYFAGRTLPVEFAGTARQRTGEAHFMVGSVIERDQVVDMSYRPAPHLFRLPDGTMLYASVDPVEHHREDDGFYTITVPVTEVER